MFKSAHSALSWAAQVHCTEIIDGPSINNMRGYRPTTSNELLLGLTQEQAHMQAEKILDYARGLSDPACGEYILVKYCRVDKLDDVMKRVMAGLLYSGAVYQRGIRKLVLSYMGAKVTHRELREALHCGNDAVYKYRDQVFNVLDKIHSRAIGEVETKMVAAGLVEGSYRVAV